MKKDLGIQPWLFPMPVLMIATYGEAGRVNVMNMAWGGVCGSNLVALNIDGAHKTAENLRARMAFTLSVADAATLAASDYFGIASGNRVPDKFERTGLHAVPSSRVDAPVVTEYPVTLECRVVEIQPAADGDLRVVGEILNVLADASVLDAEGRVVPEKVGAVAYDPFTHGYYAIGERVGEAWKSGKVFLQQED